MSWYFLRPQSPLLVGDGRSFGGGFYRGSIFPSAQVVLGAARARAGAVLGFDWDFAAASDEVRRTIGTLDAPGALRVRGVFLGARSSQGSLTLSLPRPADVLVFPSARPGDKLRWHPLRPVAAQDLTVSPAAPLEHALAALGHQTPEPASKPVPRPPALIELRHFDSLLNTADSTPRAFAPDTEPLIDERTHLEIDDGSLAATSGALYAAGRLSLESPFGSGDETGLAVELEGDDEVVLDGPWRLGGKGGLVECARTDPPGADLERLKARALKGIEQAGGRFRWILATPARFPAGWLPQFVNVSGTGMFPGTNIEVRLCAAAVDRPIACSGWDLAAKGPSAGRARGLPRPTRLLAPAGSVYFFEVVSGGATAARQVAEQCWLASVCDSETWGTQQDSAWTRAAAVDAACGLGRGMFGPWNWREAAEDF